MSPIRIITYLHARMFPKFHESKISRKLTVGFSLRLKYGFFKISKQGSINQGIQVKSFCWNLLLLSKKNAKTMWFWFWFWFLVSIFFFKKYLLIMYEKVKRLTVEDRIFHRHVISNWVSVFLESIEFGWTCRLKISYMIVFEQQKFQMDEIYSFTLYCWKFQKHLM